MAPLTLNGRGLEVAPYFDPLTDKTQLNVLYADCLSTEQIRKKASENPDLRTFAVPDIAIVWTPGKALRDCISTGVSFDFAVASHVLEHVPNPVGWLNEILQVMKVGSVLAIILPDKPATSHYMRQETTDSELVGWWLERPAIPTPSQVYDLLSNGYQRKDGEPLKFMKNFSASQLRRSYEDHEVMNFTLWSFNERHYLDVHCSVWTPERFVSAMKRMGALDLLNVEVSDFNSQELDFAVHLTKLGEPSSTVPAVKPSELRSVAKTGLRQSRLWRRAASARRRLFDALSC